MGQRFDREKSVVYQIYVRSFCDSDGDGLGDLRGITSKLDYLERLGVDYLWLTPFYPSPQRDNGYDVSDYRAVDPRYGTMEDFDELVAEAGRRGMGIMLDMVLCHTSSEHKWFRRALAGEERYRRYYILRDGRGSKGPGDPGEPPSNWESLFGGSAWEWEPRLGAWYLHLHDVTQPDLDWTNPEVRAEMADVVRFWRERGVAAFRFDVINLISKPETIEDVPGGACRSTVADGPHVHEYLKEFVATSGIDGMLTVGEMAATTLEHCIRYTNPAEHELAQTFSFHHLKVDYAGGEKWELMEPDIARLREILATWQEGMQDGGGWNALFWDNHDQPRAVTRFGGRTGAGERGGAWEHVGRTLAMCAFLMRGTPYIYQGDELGMTNPGYPSIESFRDVESLAHYRLMREAGKGADEALAVVNERSRDNCRTPMQWTGGAHAGFTSGEPWISVPANHARINAEAEVGVSGSMFEFYRGLVHMRHELEVLCRGAVRFVDAGPEAPKVIAFERTLDDGAGTDGAPDELGQPRRVLVLCSFDDAPCTVRVGEWAAYLGAGHVLVQSYDDAPVIDPSAARVFLRPYESVAFVL